MGVLNGFKVSLRDSHAFMPQEAAEAVEIKSILQLLVCEGVAAGMRGNPDLGIHAHCFGGFPHENADCFIRELLPVFTQKNQLFITVTPRKIFFSCAQILIHEFTNGWILGDNTLFPALAVNHEIGILYLVQFHVCQLTQPDSRIKEHHEDHFVSDADIIVSVEVFEHSRYFLGVEGMNQHLRLFDISHPLGEDFVAVPFSLCIGAQAFDGFQQIIDISGLASSVLQGTDVLLDVDRFQLFKLNYLKVFSNKMAEFVELFFVIMYRQIRQLSHLAIKEKFVD